MGNIMLQVQASCWHTMQRTGALKASREDTNTGKHDSDPCRKAWGLHWAYLKGRRARQVMLARVKKSLHLLFCIEHVVLHARRPYLLLQLRLLLSIGLVSSPVWTLESWDLDIDSNRDG